jgi:hypothetical protein
MSDFDFNNAEPQRAMGDLIPENTVVLLVTNLRAGGQGPGGFLKRNNDNNANMLDLEFTIDGGDHDRRKVWETWITEGETDGQQKAAAITRSRVRALLESAYGVNPGDDSEEAMAKRRLNGWGGLDALTFCAKIGVETGGLKDKTAGPTSERWPDKNKIKAILTPGDAEYIAVAQTAGFTKAPAAKVAAAAGAAAKPKWAS